MVRQYDTLGLYFRYISILDDLPVNLDKGEEVRLNVERQTKSNSIYLKWLLNSVFLLFSEIACRNTVFS